MRLSRRAFCSAVLSAAVAPVAAQARALRYDVPEDLLPVMVSTPSGMAPGTVHVVPAAFALYLTGAMGRSIRYAVGIARPGLYEPGAYFVGARKEWPSWTPTPDMIRRQPEHYARFEGRSMPGGVGNPLGARALYLFQPGRGDTFLRIHGTDDPGTLRREVSSGCARLVNDQMAHLYDRVPLGTPVYLHPKG